MTQILAGLVVIILTASIASAHAPLSWKGLVLGWAGALTGLGLMAYPIIAY